MWRCPRCDRTFASRGQVHACRPLGDLDAHFDGVEPNVRAVFDKLIEVVERQGEVEILPQATRIALHRRMSFAAVMPRRRWLSGHLVLGERIDDPRFRRVTTFSRHNHLHEFRLDQPADIDDQFERYLQMAYAIGEQHHHG